MAHPPLLLLLLTLSSTLISTTATCRDRCGSLQIKYPLGTGQGCGSPLFSPYITCTSNGSTEQLTFKTHKASYPITSISYTTSTLTLTPPTMSTCTTMHTSPTNFGLDWTSPFKLSSSTFLLLSCQSPTSSLTVNASPLCDASFQYLCASLYACPSVVQLGLPLFPPTNTCCVYAPANLDGEGELDLKAMECGGYSSVVSLGDRATDPTHWVYGVELKYDFGALDGNFVTTKCNGCEMSGGVCGFDTGNGFVCVCKGGFNTSLDCSSNYNQDQNFLWDDSASSISTCSYLWISILAGIISSFVV